MKEEEKKVIGTSDMPVPQVANYNNKYKVTQLFRNDLDKVLGDMAYVDVKKVISILDDTNNVLTAALLSEFLHNLTNLPYKVVAPLMKVIENKDNFGKYFELIIDNTKK